MGRLKEKKNYLSQSEDRVNLGDFQTASEW